MAAYMIVRLRITDEAQFARYREAVLPLIARFGGKLAAKPGTFELLEGQLDGQGMVMFEFPSIEALHGFWNAPDYVPIKELRHGAASLEVWAVQGA